MANSGLFAGVVTDEAPAEGAVTLKKHGYHFMQWDVDTPGPPFVFPASGEFRSGVGISGTENNWSTGSTDFPHPFFGVSWPEVTISVSFQAAQDPPASVNYRAFGNQSYMGVEGYTGVARLYYFLRTNVGGTPYELRGAPITLNSTGTVGWLATDWYCMTISYLQSTGSVLVNVVNMTRGEEILLVEASNFNQPYAFDDANGGIQSIMAYGTYSFENTTTPAPLNPFDGTICNYYMHDKYVDLTIEQVRRQFCALDGVVNYGEQGQNPMGEQPQLYLARNYPDEQRGSVDLGTYPDDFFYAQTLEKDVNLPPVGTATAYDPGMMTFAGGYYSTPANRITSGNKVTAVMRFNIPAFTGDTLSMVFGCKSDLRWRMWVMVFSSDYNDPLLANKLRILVQDNGTSNLYVADTSITVTGTDMVIVTAYDGDTGDAYLYANGVDVADVTTQVAGTMDSGGDTAFSVGGDPTGLNLAAGQIGYCGYADDYIETPTSFYHPTYGLNRVNEGSWFEWGGSQPAWWNQYATMSDNQGSEANMNINGTITGPA